MCFYLLDFYVNVLDAAQFSNLRNYVHMCMTCSTCISAYYVFMHIFRTDEMEVRNEYIGEQSLLYLMCGRYSKYWKFDSQLAKLAN